MEIYRNLWKYLEIYGNLWNLMEIFELYGFRKPKINQEEKYKAIKQNFHFAIPGKK